MPPKGKTDPRTRDIQLVAQTPQDGGEEGIVLHTVAAQTSLDDLVEQGLRVERESAVPGVMQRQVAPGVERDLAELEQTQGRERVGLDLGFKRLERVRRIWRDVFGDVGRELGTGVGWAEGGEVGVGFWGGGGVVFSHFDDGCRW